MERCILFLEGKFQSSALENSALDRTPRFLGAPYAHVHV